MLKTELYQILVRFTLGSAFLLVGIEIIGNTHPQHTAFVPADIGKVKNLVP